MSPVKTFYLLTGDKHNSIHKSPPEIPFGLLNARVIEFQTTLDYEDFKFSREPSIFRKPKDYLSFVTKVNGMARKEAS